MIKPAKVIVIGVLSIIVFVIAILLILPFTRLYLCARFGSSRAMYDLAIEYASSSRRMVNPDPFKHDYWLRKSARNGNLGAMMFMARSWDISNPHEVVYWLKHGCDLGNPWCAEELARAYKIGLYRLPIDFSKTGKALEYDNLAVELHRKKGTLKDHACILLPWVSPSAWPRPLPSEVHPGISYESAMKK